MGRGLALSESEMFVVKALYDEDREITDTAKRMKRLHYAIYNALQILKDGSRLPHTRLKLKITR